MRPRAPSLENAKAAVDRAVQEQRRPLLPEEKSRPALPVLAYLDEGGTRAVWRAVSDIRRLEPSLFNRFLGERTLFGLVVDQLEAADRVPSWLEFCDGLERAASEQARWIVLVPLANLLPPAPYLYLAEDAGLRRSDQERHHSFRAQSAEEASLEFDIFDHLGDRITGRYRWSHGNDQEELDTRRTADLLLIEPGTEALAVSVARTRSRLALAMWTLMKPPEHFEMWPSICQWVPQPQSHYEIEHKLYEQGEWLPKQQVRGRTVTELAPYELATDTAALVAPFEAMSLATERRCARALLSAAWSLYLAEFSSSELERTDQLLHVYAAIEALCDRGDDGTSSEQPRRFRIVGRRRRTNRGPENRWGRLTERLGVWKKMHLYAQDELVEVRRVTRNLRNLRAHSADVVLANLGYPATATTWASGRSPSGDELALARAAATAPVLAQVVHDAAAQLVRGAIEHGWDDGWYEDHFA